MKACPAIKPAIAVGCDRGPQMCDVSGAQHPSQTSCKQLQVGPAHVLGSLQLCQQEVAPCQPEQLQNVEARQRVPHACRHGT